MNVINSRALPKGWPDSRHPPEPDRVWGSLQRFRKWARKSGNRAEMGLEAVLTLPVRCRYPLKPPNPSKPLENKGILNY